MTEMPIDDTGKATKQWDWSAPVNIIFLAVALIVTAVSLVAVLNWFAVPVKGASLPIIAVGAVVVLVLLLTALTMIFRVLGLANRDQAMGLPEGSIRAVIALSLIVLFTVLSIFLYKSVKGDSDDFLTVERLPDAERQQFIKDHAKALDIHSELTRDKDRNLVKTPDGKDLYDVRYRGTPNPASEEFAKQLLVLLGTLMTAVTSFYLGANTAGQTLAKLIAPTPPPTLTSVTPTSHSIAARPVINLEISGNNLNAISRVKIVRANAQVLATAVHSNATSVTCDIPVSTETTPPGGAPWDIVVDDGGTNSVSLPGALAITA